MFVKITPYFYDVLSEQNDVRANSFTKSDDYYKPCPSMTLNTDTIRQIRSNGEKFDVIVVSDDHIDNIIITKAESSALSESLLNPQKGDSLANEVNHLTSAVRLLWELLRARLR